LIESSPRTPFAQQILKNIFACADVDAARDVDANLIECTNKLFCARKPQAIRVVARSPYFIDVFRIREIWIRGA
jgi:hypothetical protein